MAPLNANSTENDLTRVMRPLEAMDNARMLRWAVEFGWALLAEGQTKDLWTDDEVARLRGRIRRNFRLFNVALDHLFEKITSVPFADKQNIGMPDTVYSGSDALSKWRDEDPNNRAQESFIRIRFYTLNMVMPWSAPTSADARGSRELVSNQYHRVAHDAAQNMRQYSRSTTDGARAALSAPSTDVWARSSSYTNRAGSTVESTMLQRMRPDSRTDENERGARTSSTTDGGLSARAAFSTPSNADGGGSSMSLSLRHNPSSIYAPMRSDHTVEMTMKQRYGTSIQMLYPQLRMARNDVDTYLQKVRDIHIQLRTDPTDALIAELDLALKALVMRETLVYQLSMALGLEENSNRGRNYLRTADDEYGPGPYSRARAETSGRGAGITERVRRDRNKMPDEPYRVVSLKPLRLTITDDQIADELELRSLPGVRFWMVSDKRDYTETFKYAWVLLNSRADAIAFRAAFDNTDHPNITAAKDNNRGHWDLRVQYSSFNKLHPHMRRTGLF